MNTPLRDLAPQRGRARPRSNRTHAMRRDDEDGFHCKHCGAFVSSAAFLSGVQNRNHCPYCLWSRHVDWREPGDRLSACKAPMRPIGLTVKATRKKYGVGLGELMLIHLCTECETVSINRIAADDDPQTVFAVYEAASRLAAETLSLLDAHAIRVLSAVDENLVRTRLFGQETSLADILFSNVIALD
jgi:hypothetical protein